MLLVEKSEQKRMRRWKAALNFWLTALRVDGAMSRRGQPTSSWQYLGEEAGLSRIYGGIHYPSDERAGNQMGKSLAALAIQREYVRSPTPALSSVEVDLPASITARKCRSLCHANRPVACSGCSHGVAFSY